MKCTHQWTPLFPPATEQDTMERRGDYIFSIALKGRDGLRVCAGCGAIGYTSRGSRMGGGHHVFVVKDPEQVAKNRAEAAEWASGERFIK